MGNYITYILLFAAILNAGCKNNRSGKYQGEAAAATDTVHKQSFKQGEDITDYDGNTYPTVIIGKQVWMAANLKVTHYNNGDKMPNVTGDGLWRQLTSGAYCKYNNKETTSGAYGLYYNWHAVTDARKLAPKGWHVPTEEEWKTLISYLGGDHIAGSKLTATGTKFWEAPNNTATNQSGFAALPAGDRNNNGAFSNKGYSATWWTATGEAQADFATNYSIISNSMEIKADVDDRLCGLTVRCVKN